MYIYLYIYIVFITIICSDQVLWTPEFSQGLMQRPTGLDGPSLGEAAPAIWHAEIVRFNEGWTLNGKSYGISYGKSHGTFRMRM